MIRSEQYGWQAGGRYHFVPGRLLLPVPGLLDNRRLAETLTAGLRMVPAVFRVQPKLKTGRLLIHYRPEGVSLEWLLKRASALATAPVLPVPELGAVPSAKTAADWHTRPLAAVLAEFQTDRQEGLSEARVVAQWREFGPNRLKEGVDASPGEIIVRQLRNPITMLLLGTGTLSVVLAQWIEAVAALSIAAITVSIGTRQERQAGAAVGALGKLAAPAATAVRDGHPISVVAAALVPGDLIRLEAGDRVPADARIVAAAGCQVDESTLTGESLPVTKSATVQPSLATPLAERKNMLYAGTALIAGRAQAVVVATGMQTEVGRLAALLAAGGREVTPLQGRMQELARVIGWAIAGLGVAGTALALMQGMPFAPALTRSLSVAIAAMPQGLPVTVTIALSTAVARLAAQGAMVRRLAAMEGLGATTVICTDKTGTLTSNQLVVREIVAPAGRWTVTGDGYCRAGEFWQGESTVSALPALEQFFIAACLCNNARLTDDQGRWRVHGDATEGALLVAAVKAGLKPGPLHSQYPRRHEEPFSADSRRMAVWCDGAAGAGLYLKGAPDAVLAACQAPDGRRELWLREWQERAAAMAGRGLRVLALAAGKGLPGPPPGELEFLGLAGMSDQPRPGVAAAIAGCRQAGIQIIMLTGDHQETAAAVARAAGVLKPADLVLTGTDLDTMTDAQLAAAAARLAVCARVTPEHKLRVVRTLQAGGQVVAMAGDGVNDAPALQAADTGIAMGMAGTDVTKGAAGVILTDDNFHIIGEAVAQGRGAQANIRRALQYSLGTNGGEALMALLPLAAGIALPVPAALLLLTNVVCDGLVSLALATDPAGKSALQKVRPPLKGMPLLGGDVLRSIGWRAVSIGAAATGLFMAGRAMGMPAKGHAMALAGLVAAKLSYGYALHRRDRQSPAGKTNRLLTAAAGLGIGLTAAAIYVPALARRFGVAPLGVAELGLVGAVTWLQHHLVPEPRPNFSFCGSTSAHGETAQVPARLNPLP